MFIFAVSIHIVDAECVCECVWVLRTFLINAPKN